MEHAERQALRAQLRSLFEPVVLRNACELVALELTNEHGSDVVRIFIDAPGGVTVRDCSRTSHALSALLDVHDPMPGKYRLEVSSPGADRPVETDADLVRFKGFRARVRLSPREGRRRFTGVLGGLDGGDVLLQVGDDLRRFPRTDVDQVRLVLDPEEYDRLGREGLPPLPPDWSGHTPEPAPAGSDPGDSHDQ